MESLDNEVVISGIGGAFPKCSNIEEFKNSLLKNEDLITSRWKAGECGVTNAVGTIKNVDRFDASYFGIHYAQCAFLDPEFRLALERTYEALFDAGVNPAEIRGKKVGVFAGATVGENDSLFYENVVSGFGISGHARNMLANRISYWLHALGPSCAFEGNWLGGIDALQAGFEAVKNGYCSSAVVASTNLLINSQMSYLYNDMGLLSPDGATKSFDDEANGYGRSDSIVVYYLQRACDAKRSYATILGAEAIYKGNHNGKLLQIEQSGMEQFLENFYRNCNVNVNDVDFMECYGSGLKAVDEIELNAIDKVFFKSRNKPLLIGSVKPNTGHAEATCTLVSLAKALVAMETGIIPATIKYSKPNHKVQALIDGRIQVVTENMVKNPLNIVAINAVGLSSSYGHILLRANSKTQKPEINSLPMLITISSRTDEGIQDCIKQLKEPKSIDPEYAALIQGIFKQSIHGHLYRGYAVLNTEQSLTGFEYYPGQTQQIWFVYSGMGSQWCKMGADLMSLPIFANSIKKSHEILISKGLDLIKIITEDDSNIFDNILHSFVGIAAVQIALTDALTALGIVPDGILGHSVGELGCAYADGCLSAEQMILCAYFRGLASLEAKLIDGMMAAVGMGYEQLKLQCPPSIEIACHNSAESCTISGPKKDVEAFVETLKSKDVFAKLVNVSNIAYHSSYIQSVGPVLLKYLKQVIPNPIERSSKWISSSIPEEEWNSDLAKMSSAEYHTNNLLSPVRFADSTKLIPKGSIVIEVAPHGLLQPILKRSLSLSTNMALTNKFSKNGVEFFLSAIGKLYLKGVNANISALYPPITYPVSRGTKSLTPLVHWEHEEEWNAGQTFKAKYLACVKHYNISLQSKQCKHLIENQIDGNVVVPVTLYLELVLELYSYIFANPTYIVFEDIKIHQNLIIPKKGMVPLYVMVQKGNGDFEISSGSSLIATGIIRILEKGPSGFDVPTIGDEETFSLNETEVYNEFAHRKHLMIKNYRNIKELNMSRNGSVAKIGWNNSLYLFIEGMLQQYLFYEGQNNQNSLTVSSIGHIEYNMLELPTEFCEIQSTYNYLTKIISTNHIKMSRVSAEPIALDTSIVSFDCIKFVDLKKIEYQNIEAGINLGFHLVIQNFEKAVDKVTIVEIETTSPSLYQNIINVSREYKTIMASISKVNDIEAILIFPTEPLLIITNNVVDKNCAMYLTTNHAFLLAKFSENIFNYSNIVQVAQFTVHDVPYCILKKASDSPAVVLSVAKELEFEDDNLNCPWANNIRAALLEHESKRIYLVFTAVPPEGIVNFVNSSREYLNRPNIRYVFILDEEAQTFNTDEKVYEDVFKKDIILTVIKNGSIGTYIHIPTAFDVENLFGTGTKIHFSENIQLSHIGVNVADTTIADKKLQDALGNLDYSGFNKNGEKVMGLASFDMQYSKIVPDPIFCWNISPFWSLSDAVTIPHAYTMAYYILMYKCKLRPGETVLIHGGCSSIGLAAITIALDLNCNTFVTCLSSRQKTYLRQRFVNLSPNRILDGNNISFEPQLLLITEGKGAHVIVNCLSGSMLFATMRCLHYFARIAQLGQFDVKENTQIGMKIFAKNVSLISISTEEILNAPSDVKQSLFEYVKKGIKTLMIKPLMYTEVKHNNVKEMLRKLKHPDHIGSITLKITGNSILSQLNPENISQFSCNTEDSFLLMGGEPDMHLEIMQWLALRGGKHIIIASDTRPKENDLVHRLKLLETNFDIKLRYLPSFSIKNIPNIESFGKVGLIFLLPGCYQQGHYKSLEKFLLTSVKMKSENACIINFARQAAGLIEDKLAYSWTIFNIQFESTLKLSDIERALDKALCMTHKNILMKDERIDSKLQQTAQILYDKLGVLLPKSIEEVVNEALLAPSKAGFILLPSQIAHPAREVPPVFIIPGIYMTNAAVLLSSNLIYPAYCATFPLVYSTLEKLAIDLAEDMIKVYPEGPYNVIGISYSGPLALEIVKVLESKNQSTQLYLIDGAPDIIIGSLKYLREGPFRESSLLCRFLNKNPLEVTKTLVKLQDWEQKIEFVLNKANTDLNYKEIFKKAITVLLKYLNDLTALTINGTFVLGHVHLLLPNGFDQYDDCGLAKYTKHMPKINILKDHFPSLAESCQTANVINNDVIF